MHRLFIGTSGYSYPDWEERFYPRGLSQKDWLSFYAKYFSTVEINATFYGFAREESFARWYHQTPSAFTFSIKGSRFLTHIKRLQVTKEEIERFFTVLEPLQEKLSCVLWQMPGNFRMSDDHLTKLEKFLSLLPTTVRQSMEFRDSTWFVPEVWNVLIAHNIGFVISESSEFPTYEKETADFIYLRFHGPSKLYASKYSSEELQRWVGKIQTWHSSHDVYCYFNNDYNGYALENAKQLELLIKQKRHQSISKRDSSLVHSAPA